MRATQPTLIEKPKSSRTPLEGILSEEKVGFEVNVALGDYQIKAIFLGIIEPSPGGKRVEFARRVTEDTIAVYMPNFSTLTISADGTYRLGKHPRTHEYGRRTNPEKFNFYDARIKRAERAKGARR